MMTDKEIADFKMAYYVSNKLGAPTDENDLCDWQQYQKNIDNAADTMWKLCDKVMNGDDALLKLMMVDFADGWNMIWNGSSFIEIDDPK
jgi:hypothetical protein